MTVQNKSLNKGFTLIELLVVIGILAILLAITLIAINPARLFASANNTKRQSHVSQILSAIGQYTAQNGGNLPQEVNDLVDNTPTDFNSTNFPNLCGQLVTDYTPALPRDPKVEGGADIVEADCAGSWDTGYTITKDGTGRVTITATQTEKPPAVTNISVTR